MSRISRKLRDKIRRDAKDRCGYCQSPQHLIPIPFEIEHILPQSKNGTSEEENLWLACRVCNSFKHAKTHAIDPLTNIETEISIRESKCGANILNLAKTTQRF